MTAILDVSFLSGIELFEHLPDSCLEALQKDSQIFDCDAGHLFFPSSFGVHSSDGI
jgi:hypothetical protein